MLVDETFDVATVEPSTRADYWEHALSETHIPMAVKILEPTSRKAAPFTGAIRRRRIDDLSLMDNRSGPCHGHLDRSRLKNIDEDYVQIAIPTAGGERLARVDGFELGTEHLIVSSVRSSYRFEIATGISKRTLRLPRAGVEAALGRRWESPFAVVARTETPVRLLEGYLDIVDTLYSTMTVSDGIAARNATLELVAGILRLTENKPLPTPAVTLRPVIESWIDGQLLAGGDLSAPAAAAAHHVSVRTLHRMFSGDSLTFTEVVRAHRLEHARSDLVGTAESVQAVATRWGFADASHFCRVFKRQFNATPNDYRFVQA